MKKLTLVTLTTVSQNSTLVKEIRDNVGLVCYMFLRFNSFFLKLLSFKTKYSRPVEFEIVKVDCTLLNASKKSQTKMRRLRTPF